ncbi:MAG: hypothetical protein WA814_00045 [Candidatus Baltobacteraceae bacterium]
MRNIGRVSCALAIALVTLPGVTTPQASPTPARDAPAVIAGIQSYWKNLNSYWVPVTVSGSVKVAFISVPFKMTGTQYYRAPDKEALRLSNPPSLARGLQNTVATMGSPETWPVTYDITLTGTQMHRNHLAYVLSGTPKKSGSRVKTITMWVNAKTYAIESVAFAYTNGASLALELSHHGLSPYHQPTSIAVTARFPAYSGNARIQYGTYAINGPIPDSVFQQ